MAICARLPSACRRLTNYQGTRNSSDSPRRRSARRSTRRLRLEGRRGTLLPTVSPAGNGRLSGCSAYCGHHRSASGLRFRRSLRPCWSCHRRPRPHRLLARRLRRRLLGYLGLARAPASPQSEFLNSSSAARRLARRRARALRISRGPSCGGGRGSTLTFIRQVEAIAHDSISSVHSATAVGFENGIGARSADPTGRARRECRGLGLAALVRGPARGPAGPRRACGRTVCRYQI